ncbi:MAG: cardiolipin synthase [Planctomycetota bacterium]|nr:cardiolipin synthase [Planctomycetota bacterium]
MSIDWSNPWAIAWTALVLAEFALRLFLVGVVIARRMGVGEAFAWIMALLLLPVVGSLLYLIAGERKLGSRRLRRYNQLTGHVVQPAIAAWLQRDQDWSSFNHPWSPIARYGTGVCGLPPLRGNRWSVLDDSRAFLASIITDIEQAKEHVHLLTYIYDPVRQGVELGEAMCRAAKRGVACRVLVDGVGSRKFLRSDLCTRMRAAGVQVVEALPVNLFRLALQRVDLRNHRKVVVIDGRIGYVGSQNITDDLYNKGVLKRFKRWKDASARVEGPIAQALQVVFLRDWQLDAPETIASIDAFLPDLGTPDDEGAAMQVLPSGPGDTPRAIHQAMLMCAFSAREELILTTPYFVPDEPMLEALVAAATRGVAVTLVVPERSDAPVVCAAGRSHYPELLDAGVQIRLYRGGTLHSKTLTVDRRLAMIGSANLDQRSFWLNFEVTLLGYNAAFCEEVRRVQQKYIADARALESNWWSRRPPIARAGDNLARLLSPLL